MTSRYCYANVRKIKVRWVSPIARFRRWLARRDADVFEVCGYNAPVFPNRKTTV